MRPGDCYPQAVEIAERLLANARSSGRNFVSRDEYVPPYRLDGFDEKWRMLDPEEPSWTVTAHLSKDCYSHIHYDVRQSRTITIREAARLQSFPDSFLLSGSMGDRFRQIGNAVPPLLAFALAEHLLARPCMRG
jgi:DNA (cytosine-5)-methyltransferase 1